MAHTVPPIDNLLMDVTDDDKDADPARGFGALLEFNGKVANANGLRVTENQFGAPSPRPISPAAERQRRRRERRRRGAMVLQIVISPAAISDLVRLGFLRDSEFADREAVKDALIQFAKSALRHA
jgi:hypothetical protein